MCAKQAAPALCRCLGIIICWGAALFGEHPQKYKATKKAKPKSCSETAADTPSLLPALHTSTKTFVGVCCIPRLPSCVQHTHMALVVRGLQMGVVCCGRVLSGSSVLNPAASCCNCQPAGTRHGSSNVCVQFCAHIGQNRGHPAGVLSACKAAKGLECGGNFRGCPNVVVGLLCTAAKWSARPLLKHAHLACAFVCSHYCASAPARLVGWLVGCCWLKCFAAVSIQLCEYSCTCAVQAASHAVFHTESHRVICPSATTSSH